MKKHKIEDFAEFAVQERGEEAWLVLCSSEMLIAISFEIGSTFISGSG